MVCYTDTCCSVTISLLAVLVLKKTKHVFIVILLRLLFLCCMGIQDSRTLWQTWYDDGIVTGNSVYMLVMEGPVTVLSVYMLVMEGPVTVLSQIAKMWGLFVGCVHCHPEPVNNLTSFGSDVVTACHTSCYTHSDIMTFLLLLFSPLLFSPLLPSLLPSPPLPSSPLLSFPLLSSPFLSFPPSTLPSPPLPFPPFLPPSSSFPPSLPPPPSLSPSSTLIAIPHLLG